MISKRVILAVVWALTISSPAHAGKFVMSVEPFRDAYGTWLTNAVGWYESYKVGAATSFLAMQCVTGTDLQFYIYGPDIKPGKFSIVFDNETHPIKFGANAEVQTNSVLLVEALRIGAVSLVDDRKRLWEFDTTGFGKADALMEGACHD